MLRTAVLLTLCMVLTASPAFAQGLGENPLVTIYPVVAVAALVVFIAVPKTMGVMVRHCRLGYRVIGESSHLSCVSDC